MLETRLKSTQYCGVPGNTILDAVATVRDAVAHAEHSLTLDFKNAFDRISHNYLFTILHSHGLSSPFISRLRSLYEDATSSVQINSHVHGPIPIRCRVRQGCPLSMALYALCLHPLLRMLEQHLPGIQIGRRARSISDVVYADEVTIFLTSVAGFPIIDDAIHQYGKVSGARSNPQKSKILAVGRWSTFDTILGINSHAHVKILGFTFWNFIDKYINDTWAKLTGKVRMQARNAYPRDLCHAHRLGYVHTYLLAKIWYIAQIFTAPGTYTQQITSAVTYFIWK